MMKYALMCTIALTSMNIAKDGAIPLYFLDRYAKTGATIQIAPILHDK